MADKKDDAPKEPEKQDETPKEEFVQVPKEEFEGLKTKVGELGGYIDESREFIQGASVVITTLASTPELRKGFQEAYRKSVGTQGESASEQQEQGKEKETTSQGQSGTTPVPDKRIDDVVASNRAEIIHDFEVETGIDKMKPEDRKQARQNLEAFMNTFGASVQTAPLVVLRSSLEKAWLGTQADKLREEGKLEGFAQARTNQAGMSGTISGSAPASTSQTGELTPGQKVWAEKLHVDIDKAKKTYQERANEEKRVSPSEQKK